MARSGSGRRHTPRKLESHWRRVDLAAAMSVMLPSTSEGPLLRGGGIFATRNRFYVAMPILPTGSEAETGAACTVAAGSDDDSRQRQQATTASPAWWSTYASSPEDVSLKNPGWHPTYASAVAGGNTVRGFFISGWLTLETGASLLRYFSDFREIALRTRKKAG